ncbi:MAG TPA: hypothetical protein VK646_12435 [Actinomycetota bacterium]|nr:hypothetical protein [Actinomycetota bacterium]
MTNGKKKRRPAGSYRAPVEASPPRRGLLDSLFSRPQGATPMPKLRTTLGRGLATVLTARPIVIAVPIVLLVEWGILLAVGFQGPFSLLSAVFGVPPISTYADVVLSSSAFAPAAGGGLGGAAGPLLGIVLFLTANAAVHAWVTTASVESLRTGGITSWSARRALHVLPVTVAVGVVNLGLLILANITQILGGGIGFLVFIGLLTAGVYLFAFAPAIAADEDRSVPATLSRAVRAARMPGANNLSLAALYAIPAFALLLAPVPGGTIGVNPSVAAWAISIALNVVQASVVATFAYRYLCVADVVPEAPERSARG